MFSYVAIAFVLVFALALACACFGLVYLDRSRKRKVFSMMQAVAGKTSAPAVKLMKNRPGDQTPVQKILARFNFTKGVRRSIGQADLQWSVEGFAACSGIAAIVGLILGLRFAHGSVLPPVLLTILFAALPYFVLSRKRRKRITTLENQIPEALEFLARSIRAGHALTVSVGMLSDELADPLGREFRTLFNEQNLGAPLGVALESLCQRVPIFDLRFFASAVTLQLQTGGNLSEVLTQLSYVMRERFRLRGQIKAISAHGRLTSMILTGLPIITTVLLMLISPEYLGGMIADPDGIKLLGAAAAMMILGSIVIQKIVNIKV